MNAGAAVTLGGAGIFTCCGGGGGVCCTAALGPALRCVGVVGIDAGATVIVIVAEAVGVGATDDAALDADGTA